MSSYRLGETLRSGFDLAIRTMQYEPDPSMMEKLLEEKFVILCDEEKISRAEIRSIQWLFLTHYRCSECKLMPLYNLDLTYSRKVRCGKCGRLVSFTNRGKYGKMRKKLAVMLRQAKSEQNVS